MAQKIKIKVEITYSPEKEQYRIYEVPPDTIEEMAALDVSLIRSGELTYGDWDDDELITSWEVIDDGSESS